MTGDDDAQSVERRIDELETEVREEQDRYLRLAADFENFKRRTQQEQQEARRYGTATVIRRLLPVMDDLERALETAPEGAGEGWLRGVQLVLRKLRETLESAGVEPIEAVGRPFDPSLHEATGFEETSDQPEGTVVTELRRGYRLHDRVLRPSLVRVARHPREEPDRAGPDQAPDVAG